MADVVRPAYRSRADVLAAVLELRQMGARPVQWPGYLGMSPGALARALYRAGRADLANPVERIHAEQRRVSLSGVPCPECGGGVRRRHVYCSKSCAAFASERRKRERRVAA